MAIGRPISLTPNIATKAINSVATANQTDFTVTGGYRINELAVYRNGVRLAQGRDFTANDGSSVTLTNGATLNDVIEFVIFDSFDVAGTIVSAASSQNLSGDLNVTGKLYGGTVDTDSLNIGVGTFASTIHVGTAITVDAAGNLNTVGIVTASSFSGDGSSLTGVANTDYVVSIATTTGNLTVSAAATIGGAVNIDATTDSTSSSTGALIVDGGLGVAKNVYIGAGLSVAGTLTYEDVTNVDSVGLITAKSGVNVSGGQVTIGTGITMGIAGVATFSGTSDVHLTDGVKLEIGDASDLTLFHDGSASYIRQDGTGYLYIDGNDSDTATQIILRPDRTETALVAKPNAEVELYYNNSQKWETTNDGAVTTGIATATVGIDAAISVWTLGANSTNHYTFTGPGNLSATDDPTLNLKRGQKYTFKNRSGGHPFRIQSTPNGSAGTAYNTGVTNNDGGDGTNIIFDVPHNAPNVLYYQCTSHGNMGGVMYIDGSAYEISIGAGITFGSAGVSTFSGTADIHLTDGVKLKLGDSSDLHITHNGANSFIEDSGTGALYIDSNHIIFRKYNTSEVLSQFVSDGAVTLYYDDSAKFETNNDGAKVTGSLATGGTAGAKLSHAGTAAIYESQTAGDSLTFKTTPSGGSSTQALAITSVGDVELSGTAAGVKSCFWDASANSLIFNDNSKAVFGDGSDISLYFDGTNSNLDANNGGIFNLTNNDFRLKTSGGETMLRAQANDTVELMYNNSTKFATTNDGVSVTGIATVTQGMHFQGMLREDCNIVANKLSAGVNIDLEDGMVHYYSTNETTTATPNIRWNSSYTLNNKMSVGEVVTVTIIYKPNGAGYYAQLAIDGSASTEEWLGGSAPSAANAGGYDVLTHTIIKTGSGSWINLANVQNYA